MEKPPLRLIMLGNGPFAVPTFRRLCETGRNVLALVTRPPKGKSREPASRSLLEPIAHQHGTPVLSPTDINATDALATLAGLAPDLLVVCDYGQILSKNALAAARLGGVNLHASLLPRYRGAAPINWAIHDGLTETGVTVLHMDARIDAGPCLAQERVAIDPDETAVELEARLAEIGSELILRTIDDLAAGRARPIPQDPALASRAPRLKKTDGLIDWSRPAIAIKNQVRAMEPWPKTYTYWHRKGGPPLRLILGRVQPMPHALNQPPGTVIEAQGDRLLIGTASGTLAIETLQPSGKRLLTTAEFLRGYPVRPGDLFGSE